MGVWVEKAVHRLKPCRVLLYVETASYIHHIMWVLRTPIAQGNLLQNSTRRQPLQVFQVRVEQGAMEQTGAQKSFHDVSHSAVIRQPNPLCCAHETAKAGEEASQHLYSPSHPQTRQLASQPPTYLAHGLILRARPLLRQNPAPPVANQNFTVFEVPPPWTLSVASMGWSRLGRPR